MSVRVFAPAKINLTLKVAPPRADGLHPVASVVAFADVGDWIEAAPSSNLSLSVGGPFGAGLSASNDNLVLRAAEALSRAVSVSAGAAITLEKNLPVASGIGGGSSDAAATLKALNELWATRLDDEKLIEVARGLGSDTPVCVRALSVYMTGAGELSEEIDLPTLDAVLVNPLKPLRTPEVYRQFDTMNLGSAVSRSLPPDWRTLDDVLVGAAALGNDLAAPARVLMPEIATIEEALSRQRNVRFVSLSGSGATVFALVAGRADALEAAARLNDAHPTWWVRAARLNLRA